MTHHLRRKDTAYYWIGTILVALISFSACSGQNEFSWEWAWSDGGSEVEPARDVRGLATASDAVVLGSFTGSCGTREIRGEASDVVSYPCLSFQVNEVLHGESVAPGSILKVEFLGDPLGPSGSPKGEAVLFVVNKAGSEREFYRTINSAGLWIEDSAGNASHPLIDDEELLGMKAGAEFAWPAFLTDLREELAALR